MTSYITIIAFACYCALLGLLDLVVYTNDCVYMNFSLELSSVCVHLTPTFVFPQYFSLDWYCYQLYIVRPFRHYLLYSRYLKDNPSCTLSYKVHAMHSILYFFIQYIFYMYYMCIHTYKIAWLDFRFYYSYCTSAWLLYKRWQHPSGPFTLGVNYRQMPDKNVLLIRNRTSINCLQLY